MVECTAAYDLDLIFRALADPTRRALLALLARGERSVTELSQSLGTMTLAAVSKHLGVLERARLVLRRRSGSYFYLRAEPEALRDAQEWISHYQRFWEANLESLKQFIEETPS